MAVGGSYALNFGTVARAATTPTLTQFINLSNYAYSSGLVPFSPTLQGQIGYKPLTSNGKVVAQFDSSTGFYGQAFISTGAGPKKMIVAFEGTNITNPPNSQFAAAQIAADANIFVGTKAASFQTALDFTRRAMTAGAQAGITTNRMFVTGHSLGAAQAEYVSSYTGLGGATFGTPGLSTQVSGPYRNANLRNFVDRGDPVGNYSADAPRYLGRIVQANNIRHVGTTYLVGSYFNSLLLQTAASAYAKRTVAGDIVAAGALGLAADLYHPLANYARNLGLPLYGGDRTRGSGSRFFDPIDPTATPAIGVTRADRHLRDLSNQLFNAAIGGGSMSTRSGNVNDAASKAFAQVTASLMPGRRG